ncbi:helix-turn-helix transcriptional regulator [Novosphingobium sp. RL4]|uniref:helix-turn-helix domain-containing protein n=1 Tax=Novosphingobium sp. RL4 TaxID=3109595 RepID=UPI002D76D68B|nr:helix-turn-helix transcriptional regulator [Novosphingobium sp. RL4]WRT94274.1 helix-turn-helix transcriptional regulator [Novosphingobium sp. RL4]
MLPVTTRLKELRKAAVPRLSVRRIAEELDMPFGSYARFESASTYKKSFLPLDFTRKVAAVLAEHGVDPAEVMLLAGLTDEEAAPEARAVEAARPAVQYVSLQVALPSEAALRDMFRSLLVLVPDGSTKDETAEILARWLPSGFAGIGPYLPDPGAGASLAGNTPPPADATDHHESGPSSRT